MRRSWNKTIWIAKRKDETNDYGKPIYEKPIMYKMNVQPADSGADFQEFGLLAKQMQKAVIELKKYYGKFQEGDVAYLDGITPKGEVVYGANANYRLYPPRNQNKCITIYFERITGKQDLRTIEFEEIDLLSGNGIEKFCKNLDKYKQELERIGYEIVSEVLEEGKRDNYSDIQTSITREGNEIVGTMQTTDEASTYAEFGTGMEGKRNPHVPEMLKASGWKYYMPSPHKKTINGVKGWFVNPRTFVTGQPAQRKFYNARKRMEKVAIEIARSKFRQEEIRAIPNVYDNIFKRIKKYVVDNSQYSPNVLKTEPSTDKNFPLIVIEEINTPLKDETLSKTEKKYELIYETNIYAIDSGTTSKEEIINELKKLVCNAFEDDIGFTITFNEKAPNIDLNVGRQFIRAEAIIDEGNKIYRRY